MPLHYQCGPLYYQLIQLAKPRVIEISSMTTPWFEGETEKTKYKPYSRNPARLTLIGIWLGTVVVL